MHSPPRPPPGPRYDPWAPVLLVLPCNPCVRLGNYMLCPSWRVVWATVWDLVQAGIVSLAAVDSCKPGIVPWGHEASLTWCDTRPDASLYYKRQPWRLEILAPAVERDAAALLQTHKYIVHYINVKAYKHALNKAAQNLDAGRIIDAGPPRPTIPSYRSHKSRSTLRKTILKLVKQQVNKANDQS